MGSFVAPMLRAKKPRREPCKRLPKIPSSKCEDHEWKRPQIHIGIVLLMAEIRRENHRLDGAETLEIMGKTTYQLVQDFFHQQYV